MFCLREQELDVYVKTFAKYYQIFLLVAPRRRAAAKSVLRRGQTVIFCRTPSGTGVMAPVSFVAASIIFCICHHCLPSPDRAYYPVKVT